MKQTGLNVQSRFDRFQPVTVRAAARLMAMAERGRLASCEVDHYLRALLLTEPHARPGSETSLRRLARRRSAFGHTGVLGPARVSGSVPVDDIPECLQCLPEISRSLKARG